MYKSHIPHKTPNHAWATAIFCTNKYAAQGTISKTDAALSTNLQTKSGARRLPDTCSQKNGRTQIVAKLKMPERAASDGDAPVIMAHKGSRRLR